MLLRRALDDAGRMPRQAGPMPKRGRPPKPYTPPPARSQDSPSGVQAKATPSTRNARNALAEPLSVNVR
jgi:hypothetical protein